MNEQKNIVTDISKANIFACSPAHNQHNLTTVRNKAELTMPTSFETSSASLKKKMHLLMAFV